MGTVAGDTPTGSLAGWVTPQGKPQLPLRWKAQLPFFSAGRNVVRGNVDRAPGTWNGTSEMVSLFLNITTMYNVM